MTIRALELGLPAVAARLSEHGMTLAFDPAEASDRARAKDMVNRARQR